MLDLIKKLSQILNESYSEKSLVTALDEVCYENFKVKGFNIVLDEEYKSENTLYPLYKYNKVIGYMEFPKTDKKLSEFLEIAICMISLKVQNIILSGRMQRAVDFQDSMKNIAKIIETQYEPACW